MGGISLRKYVLPRSVLNVEYQRRISQEKFERCQLGERRITRHKTIYFLSELTTTTSIGLLVIQLST